MKFVFLRSKTLFFYDGHKSKKFDKTIKNIIVNHLKSFFLGFWDRLFAIGWIKEQFLKKMFLPKICSFWTKNAIFCWKFFWPHPFFGRKQTKWPKKSAEHQKYPKSWPKNFLWPSDQNSRKNLKKQTPPPPWEPSRGGLLLKLTGYLKGYLACTVLCRGFFFLPKITLFSIIFFYKCNDVVTFCNR